LCGKDRETLHNGQRPNPDIPILSDLMQHSLFLN